MGCFSSKSADDCRPNIVMLTSRVEVQRLQTQNAYMRNLWETRFSSPIEYKLQSGNCKVLDIGCGTGVWLLEMARIYPHNKYYGVDLVPIYPTTNVPENVTFINLNLFDNLPFPGDTFDFVNQRFLVRHFNTDQWKVAIEEITRVTKAFGFIECMEIDLKLYDQGPVTQRLHEAFLASMHAKGIGSTIKPTLAKIISVNPNLANIKSESKNGPLSKWEGAECLENGFIVFKMMKKNNLEFMGVSSAKYDIMLETCAKEIIEYNTQCKIHRVFCQKRKIPGTPTSTLSTPSSSSSCEFSSSDKSYLEF